MQSENSWCVWCRQVPQLQEANYNLCENIVGLTPHNCVKHFPCNKKMTSLYNVLIVTELAS